MTWADHAIRPDLAKLDEPVAYLHTMWMEYGQFTCRLAEAADSPWGTPGEDHSKCYPVTSEPLYRRKLIEKPEIKL